MQEIKVQHLSAASMKSAKGHFRLLIKLMVMEWQSRLVTVKSSGHRNTMACYRESGQVSGISWALPGGMFEGKFRVCKRGIRVKDMYEGSLGYV